MERYAIYCQVAITVLQTGASVAWLISGDWKQSLFWFGLALCNLAYILMVWR